MEKLPAEIMLDILCRLPHQTMITCKLVCKPLRDITSHIKVGFLFQFGNPVFKLCFGGEEYNDIDHMNEHYPYKTLVEINNHWSGELEPSLFDMIGSCSGLVCFRVVEKSTSVRDPIYICNPMTKEYVYLPSFNHEEAYNGKSIGYFNCGFGYHHSTDQYKVVRIYNGFSFDKTEVYTLGSGQGWREIKGSYHNLGYHLGIFANEALHWIVDQSNKIVAFDLADEEFRLIPLPLLSWYRSSYAAFLKVLGGDLCYVHTDIGIVEDVIHIWALEKKTKFSSYAMKKHEFNEFWRWSKKFSIPGTNSLRDMPFAVTKSNQVLMSYDESVFCYDPKTTILKKLWDDGPREIILAIPHVNSLVSLEAL